MKKTLSILLALALLTAGSFPAFAGGRGGGRGHGGYYGHGGHGVGGFFAGLVGGAILGTIISNSYSAPVYAAPPPAYAPDQVWVPGHYVSRVERQWVPGYWTVERYSRDGYDDDDRYVESRRVWVPGHYENVRVQVYIPGHWEERG